MARPESMKIPLTAEEKREIETAAQRLDEKPVTWRELSC